MDKIKQISEDEFYSKYNPLDNPFDSNAGFDGKLLETFGSELEYCFELAQRENRVWTVIECDDVEYNPDYNEDGEYNPDYNEDGEDDDIDTSCMYIVSGFHLVNRIGFMVTEVPYTEEMEIKLDL